MYRIQAHAEKGFWVQGLGFNTGSLSQGAAKAKKGSGRVGWKGYLGRGVFP